MAFTGNLRGPVSTGGYVNYHGARYYAPWLGRWTAADPLGIGKPTTVDLNLYAYVSGRVLTQVDPNGMEPASPIPQGPAPQSTEPLECGNQPYGYCIGNEAHRTIQAVFRASHVGQEVETDTATIGTISAKHGGDPSVLSEKERAGRPDITLTKGGVTSVWEIKPAGKELDTGERPGAEEGRKKAFGYVASLNKAQPGSAVPGLPTEPGTTGIVPAKGGALRFWSPEPGVILYKYEQQRRRVPRDVPVPLPEKKRSPETKKEKEKQPEKPRVPVPHGVPVPVTLQTTPEQPPVRVAPPVAPPTTTPVVGPAPAPTSGWGTALGVGLIAAGAAIIVGTLAADVLSGGVSIADDPASFAAAGALFARGAALAF